MTKALFTKHHNYEIENKNWIMLLKKKQTGLKWNIFRMISCLSKANAFWNNFVFLAPSYIHIMKYIVY